MNLDFEVAFLPIYSRKQANHNKSLVGRQAMKVLARPTNNAEQFCGQRQGSKFKCEHFTKFSSGLDENFDLCRILACSVFIESWITTYLTSCRSTAVL